MIRAQAGAPEAVPLTAQPADTAPDLRQAIGQSAAQAVAIARPPLPVLPYADLVRSLSKARGFRFGFSRMRPDQAIDTLSDRLCGVGAYRAQRAAFAEDIARLASLVAQMAGGPPVIALRSYFAPGDLVWHVDRLAGTHAFRLVWPIGRPAGMQVTPRSNIDPAIYRAFMAREYPLLCRLDTAVMRSGVAIEQAWAHRPRQVAAMQEGCFPFLKDSSAIFAVPVDAASIHRVETPAHAGCFHRSSWANRQQPGLQLVITAAHP